MDWLPPARTGQIWIPRDTDGPSCLLVLVASVGPEMFRVIPAFRFVTCAGPDDLIVGPEWFGIPMAISVGLDFPIMADDLHRFRGQLDPEKMEILHQAMSEVDDEDRAGTWGPDYLDEFSKAYAFHEDLVKRVVELQSSAAYKIRDYLNT